MICCELLVCKCSYAFSTFRHCERSTMHISVY